MPLSLTGFVAVALAYEAAIRVWSGKARVWGSDHVSVGPGGWKCQGHKPSFIRAWREYDDPYCPCNSFCRGGFRIICWRQLANTERGHRLGVAVDTCSLWNPLTPCGSHLHASIVLLPDQCFEGSLAWIVELIYSLFSCVNSTSLVAIYKSICPPLSMCSSHFNLIVDVFCFSVLFLLRNNYRPAWSCPASYVSDHHSSQIGDIEDFMVDGGPCLDIFLPQKGHGVPGQPWGWGALMCHLGLLWPTALNHFPFWGTIKFEPLMYMAFGWFCRWHSGVGVIFYFFVWSMFFKVSMCFVCKAVRYIDDWIKCDNWATFLIWHLHSQAA